MAKKIPDTFVWGLMGWGANLAAAEMVVDVGQPVGGRTGLVRPLHGVNNGPLTTGETVDLSLHYKQFRVPHIRLHDSDWPHGDVVDIHTVFPDFDADPADPNSYRFAKTDAYVQAAVDTGAKIIYRLGESIETTRVKHHVHPPDDVEHWTSIGLGIIRHYNQGWADGSHHPIQYWEIWNEPENRPAMWSGTDTDYFRLYAAASAGIKSAFPDLKVGGPAVGAVGEMVDGTFQPSSFTLDFLTVCRDLRLPLDFFSWHTYTNQPEVYAAKASAIRKLLDDYGFQSTEIHLTEWNYLPDNDWRPIIGTEHQGQERKQFYERQGGVEGAAFVAAVLMSLQDSPVDVGGFYAGDTNQFGLFDRYGTPKETYYAFRAFEQLLETPMRLTIRGESIPGVTAMAGMNTKRTQVNILIANTTFTHQPLTIQLERLPWDQPAQYEILQVNDSNDLKLIESGTVTHQSIQTEQTVPGPGIALIRVKPPL